MRIFLAGSTGVLGVRLVPLLVAGGHEVAGMTRTPGKVGLLRSLGAVPVICDVYDQGMLGDEMGAFEPDVVLDELTDLPDDPARIAEASGANSRIRREGTRNLIAAAAAGDPRFIAQSVAWELPGDGGAAVEELERIVLGVGGVVIRYGRLYGPGTYHEGPDPAPPPRIHVDEAARRTLPALTAPSGVLVVTEDPLD